MTTVGAVSVTDRCRSVQSASIGVEIDVHNAETQSTE
jgi:hypothetical protein